MKVIPNYHPPQDYRRPTKTQEKVYVPVNDYPEINFSMIANPLTFLTFTLQLLIFITVWPCAAFEKFGASSSLTRHSLHFAISF